MMIKILAVGKQSSPTYQEILTIYEKRLSPFYRFEWRIITASAYSEPIAAKTEETTRILQALDPTDQVILLDARGVEYDNAELSLQLERWLINQGKLVFVIGGAHGVSRSLFERADRVWSLSKLVFPHHLMRVLLLEQIYRSQMIKLGHPYHHS